MFPIFITGIGTDVGKTIVSAIVTEALHADYWKPVQAGFESGTDSEWLSRVLSNTKSRIHPETYKLTLPASPHIAAREEGVKIDLMAIENDFKKIRNEKSGIRNEDVHPSTLIIEGAGGLLVPLNKNEFVIDLIKRLQAKVILISRNYLGSINHSLLTSEVCRRNGVDVMGWVFSDQYLSYEDEIVKWSGFPKIFSIPHAEKIDKLFISKQAQIIKAKLLELL
jgi:dethiobiotin synthetase